MRAKFEIGVLLSLIAILAICLVPVSAETTVLSGLGAPLITTATTTVTTSSVHQIAFSDMPGGTVNGWTIGNTFTAPISSYTVTDETRVMDVDLKVFGIDPKYLKGAKIKVEGLDGLLYVAEGLSPRLSVNLERLGPGQYFLISQVRQNASRKDWTILFFIRVVDHQLREDETAIVFNVQNVDDDIKSFLTGQCGVNAEKDLPDWLWPVYRSRVYTMVNTSLMLSNKPREYTEALAIAAQRAQGFGPPLAPRVTQPDPEIARLQVEAEAAKAEAAAERDAREKVEEALRALQTQTSASTVPATPQALPATVEMVAMTTTPPPVPVKTQADRIREGHPDDDVVVALDENSSDSSATLYLWVQKSNGHWIPPDVSFTLKPGTESWLSTKLVREGGYTAFALSTTPDARKWVFPLDGKIRVLLFEGGEIHEG